jgi:hypothetical protein
LSLLKFPLRRKKWKEEDSRAFCHIFVLKLWGPLIDQTFFFEEERNVMMRKRRAVGHFTTHFS